MIEPIAEEGATHTEVTTLDHEVLDYAVELGTLVAKTLAERGAILLDTSSESAEVLCGLGNGLTGIVASIKRSHHSNDVTYAAEETDNN